jgi:hypothetical protein
MHAAAFDRQAQTAGLRAQNSQLTVGGGGMMNDETFTDTVMVCA